jgi:hypothetical protein
MENTTTDLKREHSGLGGLIAMTVLQIVVFLVTTAVWWWTHFATGERCGASCDWDQAAQANLLFFGIAALSFAATIVAAVISHRTHRDLTWVPGVASVVIVLGYFPAAALYNAATGG